MIDLYKNEIKFSRHPIAWFRELRRLHKWRKQRIKFGFCDVDWWDMDIWLLEILPAMLRKLANEGCGYPGEEPFDTEDKWHTWLIEQATLLEGAQEDRVEEKNEFGELWHKLCADTYHITTDEKGIKHLTFDDNGQTFEEVRKNYMDRMFALANQRQYDIQKAFNNLGSMCLKLWD